MKITFIKDCPPMVPSGNTAYERGTRADLRRGQELIEQGYARKGWGPPPPPPKPPIEPLPVVIEPTYSGLLQGMGYRDLQALAKEQGIPANLSKAELIERLADVD